MIEKKYLDRIENLENLHKANDIVEKTIIERINELEKELSELKKKVDLNQKLIEDIDFNEGSDTSGVGFDPKKGFVRYNEESQPPSIKCSNCGQNIGKLGWCPSCMRENPSKRKHKMVSG